MKDPWTCTMVGGLIMEVGVWAGQRGVKGEKRNYNSIENKNIRKKIKCRNKKAIVNKTVSCSNKNGHGTMEQNKKVK